MATRTATLYQGEDMLPVLDYTDQLIWEESEFGTRAWQGEGSASSIVIRDPLGEQGSALSLPAGLTSKSLAAKNLFVVKVGSDYLFRGRVGVKNYSRDSQHVERYRQVECNLHDTNWDLDHIFVHNYPRPAETDQARVQGLIASYLTGSPRPTTALNGSNFISSSNLVTLPEQTYARTSPLAILREISTTANKQFFVTGDTIGGGSLFYDGNDSTAYASTLSISDRQSEVNYTSVFPPIWNVGAASTEDGSEMLCEVVYFYGTGDDQFVTVHSDVVHTQYGHASATISDETAGDVATATARAHAILAHRRYEDRTYNVTIGPLTDAQVVLIEHGQTIGIKARAIPDADDTVRTMRIVQCRYTTPVIGTWFAHLQLGRPWKMQPYSVGTPATLGDIPKSASSASQCTEECFETFSRSVATGWGDSEIDDLVYSGHAAYNVNGSEGGMRQTANGGPTPMNQPGAYSLPFEILIKRKLIKHVDPAVPTGNYIDVLNWINNTGSYLDAVGVTLGWEVVSNDLSVRLKSTAGLFPLGVVLEDYHSGTWFWMRFRATSTDLYVKTWYDGSPEPDAWGATTGTAAISPAYLGWGVQTYHADADMEFRDDWYQIVEGFDCGSNCDPQSVGAANDPGDDTGFYSGSEHVHAHGTHTADYHTNYVQENVLTTAGDVPYATGPSVWTRLPIGASNFHMVSNGVAPLWAPQSAGGGLSDHDHTGAGDGGDLSASQVSNYVDFAEQASPPASPSAGDVRVFGSNFRMYSKGSSGLVVELGGAGSGGGGTLFAPSTRMQIYDECNFLAGTLFYYDGGVFSTVSGTSAASASFNSTVGHPGIIQHTTGTTATGRAGLFGGGGIILGGGELKFGNIFTLDTLSDGTNTYITRCGLADGIGAGDPARGVFFRYTDAVNSGKWEAVTRTGGVETATDTGITADTNWHRFEYTVNAGATSVTFYIDGASVGTNTTNIPSLIVQYLPSSIQKTVGLTARLARIDAYWYTIDPFTTPR